MKAAWGILAGLLFTASVFAQGQVTFAKTASTSYRITTNNIAGTAPGLMSIAGGYRFGLYAAQGAGQPASALNVVGFATNLSAGPALYGFFNGGNPFTMPAPYAAGDVITFQIKGWLIASEIVPFQPAFNMGSSPLGTTTLTASPAPPAPLFGTSPGLIASFSEIRPMPEPSSWALLALGATAIASCLRRRR